MISRIIFWLMFVFFALFACGSTNNGNFECYGENVLVKKSRINIEDIKTGVMINCVQSLERTMKSSDAHFNYIVTIHGTVEKIEIPDVYIKVEEVSVLNLKKENTTWVRDQSVVKNPPYTVGITYAFRAKHDVIDDVVSTGVYEIYFSQP